MVKTHCENALGKHTAKTHFKNALKNAQQKCTAKCTT